MNMSSCSERPKPFMDENFLLDSKPAQRLYHEYAAQMPIIDYHCHIPPEDIAKDRRFENLTQVWLGGDHYKWRAMRACGIEERFITGDASDEEKFTAWAKVVPQTVRNPLYHWTHMELRRTFGVDELLCPATAATIYEHCSRLLRTPEFSVRSIIKKYNVDALCTTDDPVDSLEHHKTIRESRFETLVAPAFRPDRALDAHLPKAFNEWVNRLEIASGVRADSFGWFVEGLKRRHRFFHEQGCRLSDYGIDIPYSSDWTTQEVEQAYASVRSGRALSGEMLQKFRSAVLYELLVMDHDQGWVQQLHLGALRNANTRAFGSIGANTGYDAIGDWEQGHLLVRLLDRLERAGRLGKTIVYSLNPRDNEMIPSILGCFQGGTIPGKMQMGSAWWFTDQKDGMTRQVEALSSVGVLSRFVGMLTDSRSFLSYPRHEYFRRILCNIFGNEVQRGELPEDYDLLGGIVQDISFNNARNYFQLRSIQ